MVKLNFILTFGVLCIFSLHANVGIGFCKKLIFFRKKRIQHTFVPCDANAYAQRYTVDVCLLLVTLVYCVEVVDASLSTQVINAGQYSGTLIFSHQRSWLNSNGMGYQTQVGKNFFCNFQPIYSYVLSRKRYNIGCSNCGTLIGSHNNPSSIQFQ